MLSAKKVEQVKALLAQGLSYRDIHVRTGVSREGIGKIARRERPDYEALRRARMEEKNPQPRPVEKCPRCGRKMRMPCRACMMEDAKALKHKRARALFPPPPTDGPSAAGPPSPSKPVTGK